MQIQQISVFVENKAGRLAEITNVLAEEKVNIRAISVADTSDFGILRLIVDKPEEAVASLKASGHTVSITSVVAMSMDDTPGAFAKAMRILADEKITVEYMYAFNCRAGGKASVIMKVSDTEKAIECLQGDSFEILPASVVYEK